MIIRLVLNDTLFNFSNSSSKLNNFMRLQHTYNLLNIKFNANVAKEIMNENSSIIIKLLYETYISLTNKEKRNLTGTSIEAMRSTAPVRLGRYETEIYQKVFKNYIYL